MLREGFQLARAGHQRVDLAGQHVAREVRVDRLDDLIVVVAHARNLGDVLVQPDNVALLRGVGPDHAERLVEDSPDDEAAAVVLHARPSQHLLEADMLLLGQAEGVFAALVVRCAVLSHRSLVLKGFTLPYAAAPQGEHLCMPKRFSAYKGTARCSRYGNMQFELDEKFDKKVSSANKELKAVNKVLTKLQNTDVGQGRTSLRLHRLTDVRPPLFKLDVFSNHSWQIVFRVRDDGGYEIVHLLTHKEADRYC